MSGDERAFLRSGVLESLSDPEQAFELLRDVGSSSEKGASTAGLPQGCR